MSEPFRADIHCHTTCSDGSDTPRQVVDLALEIGLQGLSITDHDDISAYGQVVDYALEKGIQLLPGVEFSAAHNEEGVHILGYGFAYPNPILQSLCERHADRRLQRNLGILDKLEELGMPVDRDALPDQPNAGRPHIAALMVAEGHVNSVEEAFRSYIGADRPAYVKGEQISVSETIDLIHEAGGLAILAHPILLKGKRLKRDLMEMPFDGLEGYYACFSHHQERPWIDRGQQKGWKITGGSDYHGSVKPNIRLGASWTPQETFDWLYAHFQEQQRNA